MMGSVNQWLQDEVERVALEIAEERDGVNYYGWRVSGGGYGDIEFTDGSSYPTERIEEVSLAEVLKRIMEAK